jgi:hypothetical protein
MFGLAWYITEYPTLAWMVTIPGLSVDIRGNAIIPPVPIAVLPSLLRWLTRGRHPARNCVTVVTDTLRDAWIDVPVSVVTPAHLFDWLRGEGYEFTDLSGAADPGEADVQDASARLARGGG